MASWMQSHRKAIMGGISTGVATLATSWADGSMTSGEWVAVVLATLVGAGLVFQIPNAAPAIAPSSFPPERET